MAALFKLSLVLLSSHGAIDKFEELNLSKADLPGHFLEQTVPKVLRAAVACLSADRRLLSIRRPKDEPMVVAIVLLEPFFLQCRFNIPPCSNWQPAPLP